MKLLILASVNRGLTRMKIQQKMVNYYKYVGQCPYECEVMLACKRKPIYILKSVLVASSVAFAFLLLSVSLCLDKTGPEGCESSL